MSKKEILIYLKNEFGLKFKRFWSRKPINMINFLLGCGAWKKLLGLLTCKEKHIFIESVETKVSLDWIVAYIFQDEELENVHCTFPKQFTLQ